MAPHARPRTRIDRLARALTLAAAVAVGPVAADPAVAQEVGRDSEVVFFRIATAGVNGTYYPIGAIIGNAIPNPEGSRPGHQGGGGGLPNMIAAGVSSNGSVANVEAVEAGEIESGFAQADVVHDAYYAEGAFAGRPAMRNLRVIANLYAERLQVVARKGAGIDAIGDLAGKRVSLDEPGSGTLLMARMLLDAYGLAESDLVAEFLKAGPAASLMHRGELDAFFIVAGVPTDAVAHLVQEGVADLVPMAEDVIDRMLGKHLFLSRAPIEAGTYAEDAPALPTVGVGAQWIVAADTPEDRVYDICRALWNPATRVLLDGGHPTGSRSEEQTSALQSLMRNTYA